MYLKYPLFTPFDKHLYYFFEFGAVPSEYRAKFRRKLVLRKGAQEQKNLLLFDLTEKILLHCYNDNSFISELHKKIGCSKRMFDCHKSRLLKSLREFYFSNKIKKDGSRDEQIFRKFDLGMQKEMKFEFLDIIKKYSGKRKASTTLLNLIIMYEKLYQYYIHQNNSRKSVYFYKKVYNAYKVIIKSKAANNTKTNAAIIYYLLKSQKLILNRFKHNNLIKAVNLLIKIRNRFNTHLAPSQMLKIHLRLGILYNILKKHKDSYNEFYNGAVFSKRNNLKADEILFKSFVRLKAFTLNNEKADQGLKFHKNNFTTLINIATDVSQILDFELNFLRFLIYTGDKETEIITTDYINRQILYSRKSDALNSWYLELSDIYSSSVFQWQKYDNHFIVNVNKKVLADFENMNIDSITRYKNIYAPHVLTVIYINLIEQEFWKAKDADFLLAEFYFKKLQRLTKFHNINVSLSWIETTKLGLDIFESLKSINVTKTINKYSKKLINLCNSLTGLNQRFNITSDYAKLLFIKQEFKNKFASEIIKNFENKVKQKYPELIKEIESNIIIKPEGYL